MSPNVLRLEAPRRHLSNLVRKEGVTFQGIGTLRPQGPPCPLTGLSGPWGASATSIARCGLSGGACESITGTGRWGNDLGGTFGFMLTIAKCLSWVKRWGAMPR